MVLEIEDSRTRLLLKFFCPPQAEEFCVFCTLVAGAYEVPTKCQVYAVLVETQWKQDLRDRESSRCRCMCRGTITWDMGPLIMVIRSPREYIYVVVGGRQELDVDAFSRRARYVWDIGMRVCAVICCGLVNPQLPTHTTAKSIPDFIDIMVIIDFRCFSR